jgi:hypothetical protein
MRTRAALLSPWEQHGILAQDRALHCSAFAGLPPVDTRTLIYGALLQSGLTRLDCVGPEEVVMVPSPAMRPHLRVIGGRDWIESLQLVSEVFDRHSREPRRDPRSQKLSIASCLLGDILCALRLRTNLFWSVGIPSYDSFSGLLSPELAVPLSHLWEALRPVSTSSVAPRLAIGRDRAVALEVVLRSVLFHAYVREHLLLEKAGMRKDIVVANIGEAARHLAREEGHLLRLGRAHVARES